ncbi:MAG: hypothetical protein KKA79_00010 [Nanoarchaeota archaeon]|nr:hypothetical protein [Nanoarchaeota archaeon]
MTNNKKKDPLSDRTIAGIIGSLLTAIIFMGVFGYFEQWPYEAISAYATVLMAIAITITLAWTGFSHREIMKHNQQILEEMHNSHKPILRPVIKETGIRPVGTGGGDLYDLHIKNIGMGPAIDCIVLCCLKEGNKQLEKKAFAALPPLGVNDEIEIWSFIRTSDQTNLIIKFLWGDISEKKNEAYYWYYPKNEKIMLVSLDEQQYESLVKNEKTT